MTIPCPDKRGGARDTAYRGASFCPSGFSPNHQIGLTVKTDISGLRSRSTSNDKPRYRTCTTRAGKTDSGTCFQTPLLRCAEDHGWSHTLSALLTGVTKFSWVQCFSSATPSIGTISMGSLYAAICGNTRTELRTHFDMRHPCWPRPLGERTYEEAWSLLRKMVRRLIFSGWGPGIYNPLKPAEYLQAYGSAALLVRDGHAHYLMWVAETNELLICNDMANTEIWRRCVEQHGLKPNNFIPKLSTKVWDVLTIMIEGAGIQDLSLRF